MAVPAHLTPANHHAHEAWAADPQTAVAYALTWAWDGEYLLAIRQLRLSFFEGPHAVAPPDVHKRLLRKVWRAIERDSYNRFGCATVEDVQLLEEAILEHGKTHPDAPKHTTEEMLKRFRERWDLAYRIGRCANRVMLCSHPDANPISEEMMRIIESDLSERCGGK